MAAMRWHIMTLLVGMSLLLVLSACSTPAKRVEDMATRLGLSRSILVGTDFVHVVYLKQELQPMPRLHVYLEGDGSPWLHVQEISPDPTPRHPLMLRLMALDPSPSVYLGRPCYYGLAKNPPCSPWLWTHERYAVPVVESMAAALQRLLEAYPNAGIVFLGHSGGGTLAMLLAAHFKRTLAVVTLAGNLDTAAWAAYHNYSHLTGSLNPVTQPDLDRRVLQRHYVGALDQHVPPAITKRVVAMHPGMKLFEFQDFDHACCWHQIWPAILASLEAALADK
jgi:hypothetical protein